MALTLDFTGKHAFVFGGTTGIGFGVAENFSKHGANVSVASRKQENVDAAVAALGAIGGNIVGAAADVRDFDAVVRAFDSAAGQLGTIDVLVSGAAGNFVAAVNAQSSNGFRVVVDIDLIGTFNVMRAGYPHLTKPGAAVINISAPQSFIPMRYQASACAAKAGVDQLTRVLALEWGDDGIRVNSISPGPIAGTEGMRRLASPGEAGRRRESALAIEDNAAGVAPASHNQGRERRPHYPGDVTDDLPARDDLSAAIGARRELGADYEDAVVDSFVARLDQPIAERVDQRLPSGSARSRRRPPVNRPARPGTTAVWS
jgi:NAD(P)-dependent dehydrogenase (short-subunit alcohol dehydrogenase family)